MSDTRTNTKHHQFWSNQLVRLPAVIAVADGSLPRRSSMQDKLAYSAIAFGNSSSGKMSFCQNAFGSTELDQVKNRIHGGASSKESTLLYGITHDSDHKFIPVETKEAAYFINENESEKLYPRINHHGFNFVLLFGDDPEQIQYSIDCIRNEFLHRKTSAPYQFFVPIYEKVDNEYRVRLQPLTNLDELHASIGAVHKNRIFPIASQLFPLLRSQLDPNNHHRPRALREGDPDNYTMSNHYATHSDDLEIYEPKNPCCTTM